MKERNPLQRIYVFIQKPDVKQNFMRAIWKRLTWRIRWAFSREPWVLPLPNGLCIAVPRAGSGALIYYRGWSEPEMANFLSRVLQPGMIFMDVGAHIGECVLLVSQIVESKGLIHAFEPDPRNFQILEENVRLNGLQNAVTNNYAVNKQSDFVCLMLFEERSISPISKEINFQDQNSESVIKVPAVSLGDYVVSNEISRVDIIKIDVEGAELFVLEGTRSLLSRSEDTAPILIFEYSPSNCRSLGYEAALILQLLKEYGYFLFLLHPDGHVVETDTVRVTAGKHINLVAAKSKDKVLYPFTNYKNLTKR